MRKCIIALTDTAERYAYRHQLGDELAGLDLDRDSLAGDVVSLETDGSPHDFMIIRRRWVITREGRLLEFTLDHPARTG